MGCDRQFACLTCRKNYTLGYGSYLTWLDGGPHGIKTFADFQALDSPHKTLRKNQNFAQCLKEHEGHIWQTWSGDWCSEDKGHLWLDAGYERQILIEDFAMFERFFLDEDT